jgi:drug/metabolite transporter (DMT)-like permease
MEAPEQPNAPQRVWSTGPVLALVGLILAWSFSWIMVKVGLRYSDPLTFAAMRNFLGAVVLLTILWLSRRSFRPKALRWTLLIGLLQTTGFYGLSVWALETGGAGKVTILAYTMPFWLLFMAWGLLGERPRRLQWVAEALGFAGLILVLSPWELHDATSSILAICSGLCWGAASVAVKLLHRRHQVDLLSLTAWQLFLGSLPLVVIAGITATGMPEWTTSFVLSLIYTTLIGTALAQILWLYVLRAVPAGYAGLSTLAIPVITFMLAWLALGEQPTTIEVVGIVLIVSALGIITIGELVRVRRLPRLVEPPAASPGGAPASAPVAASAQAGE